jgi:hypothetical protein
MANSPLPYALQSLPPLAPAMFIPTTMVPTVGHGLSSLRSMMRPYSSFGRLIDVDGTLRIEPTSFMSKIRLTNAIMVSVGVFNFFVSFTDIYDPTDY